MSTYSDPSVSIAICDDEQDDLSEIESMTKEVLTSEGISAGIARFNDAVSLLDSVEKGERFDILILDVIMEEVDGIQLAAALRERGNKAAIIFVSTNRDMALCGYEVEAVRYLAKPVQKEKLQEALLYTCKRQLAPKEILLPTADGQCRIRVSDILYVESWGRGTHLVLVNNEYYTRAKISDMERMLPKEKFVFCHRTLLVNLGFIQSVKYCELTLKNGESLPVSKYRQAKLKEDFLGYLRD